MTIHLGKIAAAAGFVLAGTTLAAAQPAPPSAGNPACQRLEAQLTSLDRGNDDPARADAIRRAEDATNRQQADVDRLVVQGRRTGCENTGFFSIFSSPPPQCGALNAQIQRARDQLERMQMQVEQLHGGNTERAAQRASLVRALGDNNCGPQYRQAALQQGGGFLDQLFGGRTIFTPPDAQQPISGNFRTLCVRTCDGYYFPISFSVPASRFQDDAQTCQRMCPAAQVSLYAYHNPGEEMTQAVSATDGRPYSELPTAFRYRTEFNSACSCRKPGQSWSDAMQSGGADQTVVQGDIVVTEDRAKKLSQPVGGKPLRPSLPAGPGTTNPTADAPSNITEPPKGQVRSVGPAFYPVR
jgi:TolA-binding protein